MDFGPGFGASSVESFAVVFVRGLPAPFLTAEDGLEEDEALVDLAVESEERVVLVEGSTVLFWRLAGAGTVLVSSAATLRFVRAMIPIT